MNSASMGRATLTARSQGDRSGSSPAALSCEVIRDSGREKLSRLPRRVLTELKLPPRACTRSRMRASAAVSSGRGFREVTSSPVMRTSPGG